jgi:rhomboid protease GluP
MRFSCFEVHSHFNRALDRLPAKRIMGKLLPGAQLVDNDMVIFWLVCLSCLSGLAVMLRRYRFAGRGWLVIYIAILLVALLGRLGKKSVLIYAAGAMWLLLVILPALLATFYHRRFLQQRYPVARHLARLISWLHPADGWRQQPQILYALELAQRGDLTAATETLRRLERVKSLIGLAAVMNLYRITNRWEELLAWQNQHHHNLERYPQLLPTLLRAHGETADRFGMAQLYDRNKHRIARMIPASSRDSCRLMLFAFCGKRQLVEQLLDGSLAVLPAPTRQFWLATADLAAGDSESARRQLEELLPTADPSLRLGIERRLSRLSVGPEPLDPTTEQVIGEAAREHGHDQSFGAQRSLFSNQARATQLLIFLNVSMFLAESLMGGSTNIDTLYRLGALFPPDVRAGQWWRLGASLFLHWGPLHLAMNMLALWILGPFAEFALGFRRFLLVYLLAGIGSMGAVMTFASGPHGEQLAVGASGCIMGLVGATGALMLRGWVREKALAARRRLIAMALVIGMQTMFDALIPQVSMTAHLSGALFGFVATLLLRNKLAVEARNQPARL